MLASRIISVVGALSMFAIAYALSSDRKQVDLKVVLWGIALQWVFAVLLLWVPWGKVALEGAANFVTQLTFDYLDFFVPDPDAED